MASIEDAQEILKTLGLPAAQGKDNAAYTLLGLCSVGPNDPWSAAKREKRTISKDIMEHMRDQFGRKIAPNTRETVRRQALRQFIQAYIADYNPFEPTLPTNSPRAHYAVTEAALAAIKTFGMTKWREAPASSWPNMAH